MANEVAVGLGPELVDRLFPFLLAIDAELRVVKLGRGVKKICIGAEPGVGLLDVFTINSPQRVALLRAPAEPGLSINSPQRVALLRAPAEPGLSIFGPQAAPTFEELCQDDRSTFLLDSKTTGIRLRGEMAHEPRTGLVLFLGSPWFTDLAKLHGAGLSLADFALHDPSFDFLQVVQGKTLALQELERANAAKTWFLANTSHELRTPLNGIIGMATLLAHSELKPRQANCVEKVLQSAEMLQTVVNDILDISKIEAGKLALEELDFDPAGLVHDVAGLFATSAHMKDVELVCITAPRLPAAVKGDPNRLRQVLSNLIGNAVKFTPAGEIVVRVAVDEGSAGGAGRLRFSVSDTGIGIAPEGHKLLFQPFSQIDSSMGRRFGGTGLGLAISRQLVELMGGEIGVDSTPGLGSTFWFTTRFAPAAAAHPREPESLAGLRVLVADDNATSRTYLGELVSRRGAEVQVVDSGRAALSVIRARAQGPAPLDFALLDMHMPDMTGLDVAEELALDPAFDGLARILLTSLDAREDPRVALAKVRACVTKPVRPDMLAGCLLAIREHRSVEPLLGGTPAAALPLAPAGEVEILVVDDNPVNLEVAAHMAEALGYRTEIATTGAEAVQALRRRPYRLVLMDLQMPEMDGYEATREIRSIERGTGTHTTIVAMTARVAETERWRALGAGFDDYLPKPIPLEALGSLFARWLGQREPAAPLHRPAAGDLPDAPDVIDPEAFLQLRRSGRDPHAAATKVVRAFLGDLPLNVRAILDGHQVGDLATIQAVAHRMKGSAGTVGALRLHRMCHDLETGAHDLSLEARAQRIDELLSMSVEVQRVLEAWLASSSGGPRP